MKKDWWARISIAVHPNKNVRDENGRWKVDHYNWHVIRSWELPAWITDKHRWYFQYVMALVQVRFKDHYVTYRYAGFIPETREKLNSHRRRKIASARAQVTKVEKAIEIYEKNKKNSLFNNYMEDPVYKKLKQKLEEKEFKLQQAILLDVEETI